MSSPPRPLRRRLAPPPHSRVGGRPYPPRGFDEERSCLSDETPLKLLTRFKKATGVSLFTGRKKNLFNMVCNYPKNKALRDDALRELIAIVEDAEAESAESVKRQVSLDEDKYLYE